MITIENLPINYKPYQSISFCSNNIIGGGHIFAMGNVIPLLIGSGETPRIWLQAVSSPENQEFATIVDDSKSTHPAVVVSINGKKITVSVNGRIILSAEPNGDQSVIVKKLDFRPIGLNVFGDSSSLHLGSMQLGQNTFSGVGVAFGLGA